MHGPLRDDADASCPDDRAPPSFDAAEGAGGYLPDDIITQKYRLTRMLGEGGMGTVWLARNLKLDVDVAIKLIRRELATAETAKRLLQEARAAARIGHRSIVRIFDFGETELDDPFIVMEVLTGESLREVLDRKGRLPATNAVSTLLPIASALVEAHASDIVHRDLKPENIMLVPNKAGGVIPKLVDFGIAKFRRGDEHDDEAATVSPVVGTPDYMSPEQAGGREEVDEGADVWALAVILYEAITGRLPFAGPNYSALVFAIMTETPTPIHEQTAGDAELWAILVDALAKTSDARPNMRDFGTALAKWALANGVDSDVTGTSLTSQWLPGTARSPFSGAPPPVVPDEVMLPKPPALPTDVHTSASLAEVPATERSNEGKRDAAIEEAAPSSKTSSIRSSRTFDDRVRRAALFMVAGLATVAVLAVATRRRSRTTPTTPSSATQAALPPEEHARPVEPSLPAIDPAPTEAAPIEAPSARPHAEAGGSDVTGPEAGGLEAGSAHARTNAKPASRKPPRKVGLPLAKQPNF